MTRRAAILLLVVAAAPGEDDAHVRSLIAELRSPDSYKRWHAAGDLGDLGERAKGAVPALIRRLRDEDSLVRARAAEAIGKIGPAGLPAVMREIDSTAPEIRIGLATALDEALAPYVTDAHLREVAKLLGDKEEAVRRHAACALGKRAGAISYLTSALTGADPGARAAAEIGLVTMGTPAVPTLTAALLKDPSEDTRAAAARALGEIRAAEAADALLAALSDPSPSVAGAAARAIGRTGALAGEGVPLLAAGLRSTDGRIRDGSVEGLAAYGQAAVAALVEALGDDAAREAASTALLRMAAVGVAACRNALGHESAAIRRAALETIAAFEPDVVSQDALDAVIARLGDGEPSVRAGAARVLAGFGPAARTNRLRTAARDDDPSVRAAAFLALGELGIDPGTVEEADPLVRIEALVAVAKVRRGASVDEIAAIAMNSAADPKLRIAAVDGLGSLGLGGRGVDFVALLGETDAGIRRAAARAIARTTLPVAEAIRESRAAAKKERAVESGLAWLCSAQREGGEWESGDLTTGVTGLALLALLAAGYGPGESGPGQTVARGIDALLRAQQGDGLLGARAHHAYMVSHAIASIALIEAYMLSGDYRCRRAAQLALDWSARARNPGLAWRYLPRGRENDTHVTTWMVTALRLGDAAGLRVDPEAYAGATLWIDKMTDPATGRVGYNFPGGPPARPDGLREEFPPERVETMTAAGLWCRRLLGAETTRAAEHKLGIDVVRAVAPAWSRGTEDYLYYHFGALALFQEREEIYKKWEKPLLAALAASGDEESGAWAPKDVWSKSVGSGAPTYATALGVLTLLTRTRYPRDFLTKPRVSDAMRATIAALRKASSDEDPEVRDIAAAACARLPD